MKNITTIVNVKEENCYGCGACKNICPHSAIEMIDILGEGFLYPVVNRDKCEDCGLCVKACPSLNRYQKKLDNPWAYAIKSEAQMAENSSSAGFFYILAKFIFSQGGYVCGAVYDDKFNVCHVLTNDWNTILLMRKSKYVQSNILNTYFETKEKLDAGNIVFFTGTPCQIAGLLTFLGKEYDNLLTMDVICHGVPSPGMWRKYLDENWEVDRLENIDFRYRDNKGLYGNNFIKFTFKNGNECVYGKSDNSFYKSFQSNIILRSSCEYCEYAVTPRAADFSVGDWWGVKFIRPDLIDDDKNSLLLVNSKRAFEVFQLIKNQFKLELKISVPQALANNRSQKAQRISPFRNAFFELIKSGKTFNEALKKSLFPQYDVIIVGSALNKNYGAIMTNYALYKAVRTAGYSVAISNKPHEHDVDHSICFFEKYTCLAPSKSNWKDYNWMTNTFLLGSDQLWNYKLFKNKNFYLDFAYNDKKRITYSTSFGFDYLTMLEKFQNIYPVVNSLMKRFDYISVREDDAIKICNLEHSVDAYLVLDPVFLLREQEYSLISKEAKHKIKYKYVTSYSLSASESVQFNNLLLYVSEYLSLPTVNMLSGKSSTFEEQRKNIMGFICKNLSVEEWLYNMQNGEFIVTDSFHGTCFSIIFKKNFIVIQKDWGISRLTSLLNMFGLQDRLIHSFEEIKGKEYLLEDKIDYKKVYRILNEKRIESLNWLMYSLKANRRVSEHYYVDDKNMMPTDIIFRNVKNLFEYLEVLDDNFEEYVLIACSHGNSFNREYANSLAQYCMKRMSILDFESYKGNRTNGNLLKDASVNVIAKGNGKRNCRTLGILMKEAALIEFRQKSHQVYSISFDWNSNATKGSFRIQLGQSPWDSLTEDIQISSGISGGHYENIYISSSSVDQFESGEIQIRTDEMDNEVFIENLKIQKGNCPTEEYSVNKKMNGFALICNYEDDYLDLSVTSMGRLQYHIEDIRILLEYSNQGYRNCRPISELYIDNTNNRFIYPLKRVGLYLMLYSKISKKIVDISYLHTDPCNGELIHM